MKQKEGVKKISERGKKRGGGEKERLKTESKKNESVKAIKKVNRLVWVLKSAPDQKQSEKNGIYKKED